MKTSFRNGQTPPIGQSVIFKKLGDGRANHRFQLVPFVLLARIPSIHVLADHDGVDAHGPHEGRAMPTGFELVIDLLALVGTLNGGAALVHQLPTL